MRGGHVLSVDGWFLPIHNKRYSKYIKQHLKLAKEEGKVQNINATKRKSSPMKRGCMGCKDGGVVLGEGGYERKLHLEEGDAGPWCSRGIAEKLEPKDSPRGGKLGGKGMIEFVGRKTTNRKAGTLLNTWDVLFDMGTQGLEISLPQLIEGCCNMETVSSCLLWLTRRESYGHACYYQLGGVALYDLWKRCH